MKCYKRCLIYDHLMSEAVSEVAIRVALQALVEIT